MKNPFKSPEQTTPGSTDISQKPEGQEKKESRDVPASLSPEAPVKDTSKTDITKEVKDDNGEIIGNDGALEPNNTFILNGIKYSTDDIGKLFRVGDELLPNCEYTLNGYKYTTDDKGRIISAEGRLHLKTGDRLNIKDSIDAIGKGDQLEGDDRGHLIGDQFDGANGLENMIPQDADINRYDFKFFENSLAKAVKDGKDVYVKIEPIYEGDSRRPVAIVVTYSIDGNESVRIFPNGKE